MIVRRKFVFAGSVVAALWPYLTRAQTKILTIGLLWIEPSPYRKLLVDALREHGYVEGQNVRFLDRTTKEGYGQLANNARELVQAKMDVIATYGATATNAAAKATQEIPIVMASGIDPVAAGLAVSLARPGGNVTGVTTINASQLASKRVELLKDLAPRLKRVGVLFATESVAANTLRREITTAIQQFKLQSHIAEVHVSSDLERAFEDLSRAKIESLIVSSGTMLNAQAERIVNLAAKYRMPAVFGSRQYTDAGGLMSFNADFNDTVRRAATYIDRLFKGARAGDLPIEQPTRFELVVNLRTAKALGITIPQSIFVRATRVIE